MMPYLKMKLKKRYENNMDEEERLKEIKIKLEKSNKYMIFVDYDDTKFLMYIIDKLQKNLNNKNNYTELKSEIEKNILDELEVLTRDCYRCDLDKIKILSESYKNLRSNNEYKR